MSRRFIPWVNTMTDSTTKQQSKVEEPAKEVKQNVVKIEYKLMDRMEKTIECKMIQSTYPVTKGYAERRKKAFDTEAFGVDKNADEIRNNIGLTIVQRDNIWHPYYEVKLEEEDLGSKYRKNLEQKKQLQAVDGQAIEEIQ